MSIFPPRLFAVFLRNGYKKADSPPDAHKKFTFCRLCFCSEFVILIWYVWIGAPI